VIELSSYQLADLEAEPTLAVILNLSPEHLDWHGGADAYRRDKLRLAALAGDRPLILNASDRLLHAAFAERGNTRWFNNANGFRAAGRHLYDGDRELPLQLPAGLPGSHNLSNIAAVMTVTREIGLPLAPVMESVACFRPLPHRLQLLGERAGLRFVNDSISSTPVATVAALESFDAEALTLIVGGLDRGLDWAPYADAFAARSLRAVIGVPDSGPRIVETLRDAGICPPGGLHLAQDLGAAVALAREISPPGAVVLLSPGAPSFPRFRDYRDRGLQFAGWCGLDFEDSDPF